MGSTHNYTQTMRIVSYCRENDGITSLDAVRDLGIIRLASRINDLRHAGYIVQTEWEKVFNRFGEETRVKRYRVKERDEES